jgi:hypothetical protein
MVDEHEPERRRRQRRDVEAGAGHDLIDAQPRRGEGEHRGQQRAGDDAGQRAQQSGCRSRR